ncbi:MAG: CotH kinase family protein [Clostridia bacterium]|nr:CotH kinase family protein [Clostridia bacterium]
MLSSKHISKITIALISAVLILCILAMTFYDKILPVVNTSGYSMEYQDKLFDTSNVLDINIVMDDAKWNEMLQNARQEQYYECDVVINGTTFKQVGIRPKGNTSLSSIASDPNNNRYSFKLEFDQFVDGQTCFGLDKLILNNSYADTTNMKEAIIYDMFQYLDADASLYNYAKISVNNEYWGVYLALEAVEDSFMLRNYGMEKGYLYKPDSMNFAGNDDDKKSSENNNFSTPPEGGFRMPENFGKSGENRPQMPDYEVSAQEQKAQGERKSFDRGNFGSVERMGRGGIPGGMGGGGNLNYTDDNTDSYQTIWNGEVNDSTKADHERVVQALKNVNNRTNIEKYIDVDQVLKYMAVHNFSVNEDSLSGSMAHNYYLYEANGQISILPWDYNLSLGGMHGGDATSVVNEPIDDLWQGTKLFDFVLENEEYKVRYHEYYSKLVNEYLYGGKFDEVYNRIRTRIDELVKTDPNAMYSFEEYSKGVEVLYDAVILRAESIKGQLDGTIPSTAEGQKSDSSKLVDASHINLSDLGQFMMGGGGNRQMPGRNNAAALKK